MKWVQNNQLGQLDGVRCLAFRPRSGAGRAYAARLRGRLRGRPAPGPV